MVDLDVHVTRHGPLFDGRAVAAVAAFRDDAERKVAEAGVTEVRAQLGAVLQNETGFYRSHVIAERASDDYGVTDQDVIYGPWLEGTSSRNQSTRFKGYGTFRKVRQWLEDRSGGIAETSLRRFIGRMD